MNGLTNSSDQPHNFQERWSSYYKAVEGRSPRETLLKALACFESSTSFDHGSSSHHHSAFGDASKFAVDLGCGDGRDTVELLRQGWQVLAIDGQDEAIARLLNRPNIDQTLLDTRVETFENLVLPENSVDLINASFCLPFCESTAFSKVWAMIITALRPGGIFCGHLFGDRDSWATNPGTHHLTRSEVDDLLQPFSLEWFDEEDHPGKTALGDDKHWHIFNIVARKR
ncbi:MAG: class I SAM-dependent methyltransferase [Cyanobacteria bacterium P01_E01_bin.6]